MHQIKLMELKEDGIALVIAILFLFIFSIMGAMLMYTITSTVKSSGLLSLEASRYYSTEGGVLSVISYMTLYKRVDVPKDVTDSDTYSVSTLNLGQTVRYPVGYSTLWKGVDVRINSKSPPPPNDKKEIEAVAFIPTAPVGYGNE
jgi:hypothetical protein